MSPAQARLRSDAWLRGGDEVALAHRAAFAAAGLRVSAEGGRPVIGIANSASDLNPCNLPLRAVAGAVADGIRAAGGVPAEFGSMSLGEDLMKPSAMLYRNLLAIEIEEMIRSNPLDGIVLLAGCDKTVPGAIMGAVSADLPMVVVTSGSREPASFRGRRLGTGSDLWRLWEERRAGRLDDAGWQELERCLGCATGTCNTMGTASTMAVMSETLGLMVPGSATIPAADPRAAAAARTAGAAAVEAVLAGRRPSAILTPAAFRNAIRMLHAIGGSTNAVIHLAAIAGRAGVPLPLAEFGRLGQGVPVLADVEPSGTGLLPDLDAAGGVPALLRELGGLVDGEAAWVTGTTAGAVASAGPPASGVIRSTGGALGRNGAFAVVSGSLAPGGAVVKTSAATPALLRHRGPALVFHGYDEMRRRVEDPALPVTPDTVLVLAGCGRWRAGHAGVGHDPDPGQAGRRGRHRHGAGDRRPDERDQLRHRVPARSPRGRGGRPAGPGPRRRPGGGGRGRGVAHPGRSRDRTGPPPGRLVPAALAAPARLAGPLPRPRAAGTRRLRPGLPAGPDGGAPPVRGAGRRPVVTGPATPGPCGDRDIEAQERRRQP